MYLLDCHRCRIWVIRAHNLETLIVEEDEGGIDQIPSEEVFQVPQDEDQTFQIKLDRHK